MTDTLTPYDKIIYPEGAYAVAHPDRMSVVASLLGMKPPPVATARILELGTGTGGHIIPIAYQYPDATCVGIDYARAQIEIGLETIAAVGLNNLTLHAMNFMDVDESLGQFDYIIAHGIFSWIPVPVQHQLLEIVHRHLTPNGVAYISYNAYPGWRMLDLAGDLMRFRTRGIEDPWERVAAARAFIGEMAGLPEQIDVESSWKRFMATHHQLLVSLKEYLLVKTDHVLLHDDMEETNQPFYFYQFCELLDQHALTYLADSTFPNNMLSNLTPAERELVEEHASNFGEVEQYMDFVRNRTFRTSLIVHEAAEFTRALDPRKLAPLYISTLMRESETPPDGGTEGTVHFVAPDGKGFATKDSISTAAIRLLIEAEGGQVAFRELVRSARARAYAYRVPLTTEDEDASQIASMLLACYGRSIYMIDLYATAPSYALALSERPLASKLARYQAISSDTVTNQRQKRVNLGSSSRALIGLLDGTNDRAALLNAMKRMLVLPEDVPEAERNAKIEEELDQLLRNLQSAALLVG
ncbi:MAG TPA: class I SAM-dependent methyltransferase [Candidatus Limnocylindrales bacterium]|nr:class I SAM-dependent methyltransferase [Candidatus Limnocylindrales bacterium]